VSALHHQTNRTVAYVTDVEGCIERLLSFCAKHTLVRIEDPGTPQERLVVAPGSTFVFGGDAVDRGPAGRRVVSLLLEAKLRQPNHVVLLGGNRDLNKLRVLREVLGGVLPKRAPAEAHAWNHAQRLRYIFEHTMGAAHSFEHRRTELRTHAHETVHDSDVVESFVEDLRAPHGMMFRYLQQVQLAYVCGGTLYVHGGVDEQSLGRVPHEPPRADLLAWVEALNAFCAQQVAAYADDPVAEAAPFLDIVRYQAPTHNGRNPASVVYGRLGDNNWNNPRLPSSAAGAWLHDRGLHRVVVGHTPSGDLPVLMRDPVHDVEYVVGDTTRARLDDAPSLHINDEAVRYRGACALDDGTRVDVDAHHPRAQPLSPVGMVTMDGSFIKAVVGEEALLFRFQQGYEILQQRRALQDVGPLHAPTDAAPVEARATTPDDG
jgi:hypothetical protein